MRRHSEAYNFIGDRNTGLTVRWGRTLEEDPDVAPWPELADISISNRCSKNCSFCYRDSRPDGNLMDLEDYIFVLDQLTSPVWGPVFQVAIGGGEPTEHPQLVEMLEKTRDRGIVANLTTNGLTLSDEHLEAFKRLCGAVAISISAIEPKELEHTISRLTEAGIRTNLHFLLSRRSIATAIDLLKGRWDGLLSEINAVIFLTHKAMGRAARDENITIGGNLAAFLSLVDSPLTRLRLGFDSCFVPMLLRHTNVDSRFVDSCECGFFSVYIDEQMTVKPCSFAIGDEFSFSLSDYDFGTIWLGKFDPYRKRVSSLCSAECDVRGLCRGPCPYHDSVNLCSFSMRTSR
jgi:radical SAM protein with 4Fe4S-binding SPASM domain